MRGQNVVNMFVINHLIKSEVCVITKLKGVRYVGVLDMSGEFYGVPSNKYWRTGNTDLGYPNKKKILKSIILETQKDIELKIFADSDVYSFDIKGMSGFQTVYPRRAGKRIALEFISRSTGNCVSDPQITVGVYD